MYLQALVPASRILVKRTNKHMNKTQAGMEKNSYSILVLILMLSLMLSLLLIWLWLMVLLLLLVLAFNLFYNSSQHKKWPQNFNFFFCGHLLF